MALVSPLGLSPSEHVFLRRAEVSPHSSGAFVDKEGNTLPLHDCAWIPASRPWSSRVRLLAQLALSRAAPLPNKAPVILIAPPEALEGDFDLARSLSLGGRAIVAKHTGSAAYLAALQDAAEMLEREPQVIVLAVDSHLSRGRLEEWFAARHSRFTRNPLPPCEGAAAVRLVPARRAPLAGKVLSVAWGRSPATDRNDLPADGAALTQSLTDLGMPARIPLVVGPRDEDPLRMRDFHIAATRHYARFESAEMPSLEGKMGTFGSAAGLMSAVFALAWLRHDLPLPATGGKRAAVSWARSEDGVTGAALLGDASA
jgi:hypothetical protein